MMKQFLSNSYLFGGNAPYVEELYEAYLNDPAAVPQTWREYFDKLQLVPGAGAGRDVAHAPIVEAFAQRAKRGDARVAPAGELDRKQVSVIQLVAEYRFRGCLLADLDPLKRQQRPHIPELEPGYYDLTEADMDTVFNTGSLIGPEQATLREIIRALQETYCGTLGVEYMYISSRAEKRWIQERLEPVRSKPSFSPDYKKHILERLTAAEGLERYLHTRYVGQKRFSLEGGDTLIPMLDNLLQRAGEAGVQELVIGMAHRGRLNVLVNILGKMPKDLFSRIRGQARRCAAGGRRQVPPGVLVRHHDAGRADAPDARVQSVAPGDRQSGGRGLGARAPAPAQGPRRRPGAAGADPRRRRVRRPGRGDGDAEPVADARLRHRRHGAHRGQQPDRLHHLRPARQRVRRCTAPTSRKWSRRRSSTSTATIRRPA